MLELFSGSQQLSEVAQLLGWDTVTLDNDPKTHPDICCDIMTFDYTNPRFGFFDLVHASIPCQEFSQCKTRAPRDLVTARKIGRRARQILDYFCKVNKSCVVTIENPASSLLQHEHDIIGGLSRTESSYCCYAFPYRKSTSIWHNMSARALELKTCPLHCCWSGAHPMQVQHSPLIMRAIIPANLCFDLLSQIMKYCNFQHQITMGPPPKPPPPPKTATNIKTHDENDEQEQQPEMTTLKKTGGRPRCQRKDMICSECFTNAQSTERMYNCSNPNLPILCTKCYRQTKREAKREQQRRAKMAFTDE